jgi:hypothetical protein
MSRREPHCINRFIDPLAQWTGLPLAGRWVLTACDRSTLVP